MSIKFYYTKVRSHTYTGPNKDEMSNDNKDEMMIMATIRSPRVVPLVFITHC